MEILMLSLGIDAMRLNWCLQVIYNARLRCRHVGNSIMTFLECTRWDTWDNTHVWSTRKRFWITSKNIGHKFSHVTVCFYEKGWLLQQKIMIRKLDVMLAATPNQASSGRRRRCSTSTIENDVMALMPCPSLLSAPTLMGHYYSVNAILEPPTRLGGKMWCWRPPQIRPHQDRDEDVAPP